MASTSKTLSEAIASALIHAGVKVVTYVPGLGGNEIYTDYNKLSRQQNILSFHEEVAYSIAHGASLAGVRTAALLKSHGIIKAGNSVTDSLYSGNTAGMVVIIFDDKDGQSSDSILDIGAFLSGIHLPYQIAQKERVFQQIIDLFDQSEKRKLPQALVVDANEVMHLSNIGVKTSISIHQQLYQRDIMQHVLCPFFADYQYKVLIAKERHEDWKNITRPANPRIPDSLPQHWKHVVHSYSRLFNIFKSIRGSIVIGDTGVSSLFACEPFDCIDITTYMGGSIPLSIGAYLAGHSDVWAVTGDFSFISAGYMGLLEAWQRRIPIKVLILYNGKAETTGGQLIPDNTLEMSLSGYQKYISHINPYQDEQEIKSALIDANGSREMRIVVVDYTYTSVREKKPTVIPD